MVCFSRLASPSIECILDSLPLMDLLGSVSLCRLFGLDQVPAALRRRRHLKLLVCPSSPSGLRLWATLPIDPLAIYRIRELQQRQRQQGYEWDSKPGDDGSIRGHNILVLTQLRPSTTLGLLDAFPLIISLTFVQCAVSVATTVQLIVLLKSAWSIRLQTLKLYLNQYPELGPIRTDSIMEEDLLLDWNQSSRRCCRARRIGPYAPRYYSFNTRGDRLRFWQRQLVSKGVPPLAVARFFSTTVCNHLVTLYYTLMKGDSEVASVYGTLCATLAAGGNSLPSLRKLTLHTDVARYGTFRGPAVLYKCKRGPVFDRALFTNFLRRQLHLSPPSTVRCLHLHLDQVNGAEVNGDYNEVCSLLDAQLYHLQHGGFSSLASIRLTTPLTFSLVTKLLRPENGHFTRRFRELAVIEGTFSDRQLYLDPTQFLESFADYFSNLRSLSLLALRPANLAFFLDHCSRLYHLRHLTITWSNSPPLRFPQTGEPPRGLPALGTLTSLTLYYLGAIADGHDALQPLLNHWAVTGPAFPAVTTFAFHVIGEYQCNDCQTEETERNGASSCQRQLAASLAVHAPVLKSFKMISQWEEKIGKHDGESDNEEGDTETKDYDLPQTVTRYNFTEITDF